MTDEDELILHERIAILRGALILIRRRCTLFDSEHVKHVPNVMDNCGLIRDITDMVSGALLLTGDDLDIKIDT